MQKIGCKQKDKITIEVVKGIGVAAMFQAANTNIN